MRVWDTMKRGRNIAETREGQMWRVVLPLGVLAFILLAWLHYRFVVAPLDYANKDFMSLWTGARALLQGLNPYDADVWQPLRAQYGSSWMPDPRAPFPLWTFLAMVPFALLPLSQAAAAWLTFQECLLAVNLFVIVVRIGKYRPGTREVALLGLGAFLSASTVLVLINGQMTFLLLQFLSAYLLLEERSSPFWAGVALSLLAFKPNPFVLFVPLFGLWLLWQRRWRVVAGAAVGGFFLLGLTTLIQPGWLLQWLNVRSKTEVVSITPTVWGLAAEISPAWWLPVGLLLAVALTAGVTRYVFWRPGLDEATVVAVALAASLLVTPYTWAYEHALLFLPWILLFARLRNRRLAQLLWVLLAWLVPWLFLSLAAVRLLDTFGFMVPALALWAIAWHAARERAPAYGEGRSGPATRQ